MQQLDRAGSAAWGRALLQRLWGHAGTPAVAQPGAARIHAPLLVLGHSHIQALIDAQTNRVAARDAQGAQEGGQDRDIAFIKMLDDVFNPNVQPQDGTLVLNPALAGRLQDAIAAVGGSPVVIDCVSGNEYHFFGLVQHSRPFDFVLASAPDLPLQPGAEIIPATLVEATMREAMQYALAILTALRAATTLPIWHVQSPPPIRSQAHILAHPTQFKDAVEQYGVAPPTVRWKLWQLQSQIYCQACEAAGIRFLPTPTAALDPAGFLLEAGWNPDPTHANSWYGELVLAQLATLPQPEATA